MSADFVPCNLKDFPRFARSHRKYLEIGGELYVIQTYMRHARSDQGQCFVRYLKKTQGERECPVIADRRETHALIARLGKYFPEMQAKV